jgi:hypothetical protein
MRQRSPSLAFRSLAKRLMATPDEQNMLYCLATYCAVSDTLLLPSHVVTR